SNKNTVIYKLQFANKAQADFAGSLVGGRDILCFVLYNG
ncbi:hypothetical protein SAMN04487861_1491, partial [Selenomonas ruminantium]